MTTYNTYQEAKIANPECEIITRRSNEFKALDCKFNAGWRSCKPADQCMTVEQFLKDGHKFKFGDLIVSLTGTVSKVNIEWIVNESINEVDRKYFILRAVALENQMNIDNLATQTPEEKEALAAVDFSRACEIGRSKLKSNPVIQLSIDEIDKFSGEIEWNGEGLPPVGVECEVRFRTDGDWTDWFSKGKLKAGYDSKIWFSHEFGDCVYPSHDVEFRKPETPQQREERERLEAAYDLYLIRCHAVNHPVVYEFHEFKSAPEAIDGWLAVVDKTNYRKESNQ